MCGVVGCVLCVVCCVLCVCWSLCEAKSTRTVSFFLVSGFAVFSIVLDFVRRSRTSLFWPKLHYVREARCLQCVPSVFAVSSGSVALTAATS